MTDPSTTSSPARVSCPSRLNTGAGAIEIIANTVRLPAGTGFDPGGIGKGLAADIVSDELRAAGAEGVCINLGGDVRVDGTEPDGGRMDGVHRLPGARPTDRARRSSHAARSRRRPSLHRRWRVGGEIRHHLIDPATGLPSDSNLTFVSVVAGHAWTAEVLAKAVLLHGTPLPFDLVAAQRGRRAHGRSGRPRRSVARDRRLSRRSPTRCRAHRRLRAERRRIMTGTLPWYIARAAGLVAWALLAAATLWGLALSTKSPRKALGPDRDRTGSSTCTAGWAGPRSPSPECT